MKKKFISIVIPARNEEGNISAMYKALQDVWANLPTYDWECIFVDDGSTDGTKKALRDLCAQDPRVKGIYFTKNFGKEMATTAGLREVSGGAAILLDADLQHPPSLILDFVKKWEEGADMVVGIRNHNADAGFFDKTASHLFYLLMRSLSNSDLEEGETDFRLIDRKVITEYNRFTERERMTRALMNELGFPKEIVFFDAPERMHGEAQYSFGKLVHLALSSFIAHSIFPLKLVGYLGLVITIVSGALGVVVFFERYVYNDSWRWHVSGPAQLAIINVFLVGVVLMALGIIGLYVSIINRETSGRPLYVVRERTNF